MTPNFLTLDDLLDSHTEQIATYGGTHGVRDIGLLESARAQPEAQFGGQYLHADLFERPVRLPAASNKQKSARQSQKRDLNHARIILINGCGNQWLARCKVHQLV